MLLYKLRVLLINASLLLLIMLPRNSESLQQFPTTTPTTTTTTTTRRTFFIKAASRATSTFVIATTTTTTACCCEAANAAIDVSGLRKEEPPAVTSSPGRGVPPNQVSRSGPLAGTKLGFQVGGGPRSEEEVRKIDEPRYAAVRKAQGLGPLFLEGVPIEQQQQQSDTNWMR